MRIDIVPTLRYRNAAAAIEWLCRAFGFERHLVSTGEGGIIEHAQLTLGGTAMIMLGTARDDAFGRLQQPPAPDGPVTQSPYVVIDDVDAHYARAVAAGARVVIPLRDEPYGGRHYSCLDPEGHLWNFGSYDPWS